MAKIRVHELAKELNIPSKELVKIIQDLGIDVKNHMSTMEEQQGAWVKKKIAERQVAKPVETGVQPTKKVAEELPKSIEPKSGEAQPSKSDKAIKPRAGKAGPLTVQPEPKGELKGAVAPRDLTAKPKPVEDRMPSPRNEAVEPFLEDIDDLDEDRIEAIHKPKPSDFRIKTFSDRTFQKPHKGKKKKTKKFEQRQDVTPEMITVGEKISVRELADKLVKSPAEIVKKLMLLNINVSLNNEIDFELAELIASDYNVKVEREKSEEELILEEIIDDEASLQPRPPVVTVMGHVDHGKTSLLDSIRETNVVAKEAGGITQHIGAYQVEVGNDKITFLDTPGHEAFTAMRSRGAQATDIAILVVAADDGVMPQTIEAINHARAAGVPIIVAINKIDKENANPERVKQQLAEYNVIPEEWGGDTIFVPVSAKTRQGIDQLMEMILLLAEIRELKANPNRPAEGVVIEGELDKNRGPVATVLVQKGTLKVGDTLICGTTFGKVRAMINAYGRRETTASPSTPMEILGLADVPMAGDKFQVVEEKVARQINSLRLSEKKREEQNRTSKVTLDDLFKHISEGKIKELNLIVKGDVQGSVEALTQSLNRLSTDEVKVNVIHSAVGAVTESDVDLASASNAIIIGFNVRPDSKARKYAEEEKIDVRLYRVIYEAIDDVKNAMAGLLEPEHVEKFQGRAEVRAVFKVPKTGIVAGCYVIEGKVTRNANVRVLRDGVIIYDGKLLSLRRFKDDVREVQTNFECGMAVEGFNDLKEGDIIETYTIEDVPRVL